MTVAELIEKLRTFDPWLPLLIPSRSDESDYDEPDRAILKTITWINDDEPVDTPDQRLCVVIEP